MSARPPLSTVRLCNVFRLVSSIGLLLHYSYMDPTTAYLEMFEAMNDKDFTTARERAQALKEWLGKDGFYPPNYSRVEVDAYLANVLRRTAHIERSMKG